MVYICKLIKPELEFLYTKIPTPGEPKGSMQVSQHNANSDPDIGVFKLFAIFRHASNFLLV